MGREYSWETASTYTPPRRKGLGWYVLVAVILALTIHVAALVMAGNTFYRSEISEPTEWVSKPLRLTMGETEIEEIAEVPPEEELERPVDDSELVDDPESAIAELHDIEIDIDTNLEEMSLPEMRIEKPILAGVNDGDLLKPTIGVNVDPDIPDPGKIRIDFPEAKKGQVVVDEGTPLADVLDPDKVVQDLGKLKGEGGSDVAGEIKGYTGLSAYANMSPGDLQRNKATIGSDLLFEFNSATLRDDARITLLTVAQLIDRNPGMFCWVEGHTDTIGGEDFNLSLSQRRGEAVKNWLVRSLQLEQKFIVVRAFGKAEPIVKEGDREAQAANRRVDIKMRKTIPTDGVVVGMLGKPGEIPRGIPVDDDEGESIPKAIPVPDDEGESIPKAITVPDDEKEAIPKAITVPDDEKEAIPKA
ncbi:MAG: OmpA family protein, partial [Akkermansiaceae bacterium]